MAHTRSTAVLTLLIASLQFAGGGIVANSGAGPAAAEYFCCCPGECHCTADCCNHAPETTEESESPIPRIDAGTPILEAPRSCGTWTATLSRSPESPKAFPAHLLRETVRPPNGELRQRLRSPSAKSSAAALQPSSPRAPPIG